ncbi:hypothetical protein MTsPCn5_04220 [Croceitalea sp. MTPC5]|uniref:DUF4249 family protein n=1 Tax=Croceitalea sp. MTPC5 TaxID=3056565 RepID=UPI002B3BEDD1|nr:hypothetical protein MTsPCn5_04220 [Croceitalea sp. MTPC5]
MRRIVLYIVLGILFYNCVDEVDLAITTSGNDPEDILIVEGTLTNELKKHTITLSTIDTILDLQIDSVYTPFTPPRDIERDLVNYEENAQVVVVDGNGVEYGFDEVDPGIYESSIAFAAQLATTYQLLITTSNGRSFSSEPMQIQGVAEIDGIHAAKTTSDTGAEGIGIFITNNSVDGNSQNLRFTYSETYKIIAPLWRPQEFRLTNYDPCALPVPTYDLEIVDRTEEQRVCYATEESNTIVQTQLSNLNGSGLEDFMVRFLGRSNFAISHRYSIEVAQLVSSPEAFGFYEQLDNFSQSDNVFSQVQPGFLEGNITADNGREGAAIGFFDVASVSKTRLFFNYSDFYPDEPLPPFPFDCGVHSSPESHVSYCFMGEFVNDCPQSIIERIDLGVISYVDVNSLNLGTCPGPYLYVASACGDCTRIGTNVVPEFWIEE